jgi:prolyl oligopeptidase
MLDVMMQPPPSQLQELGQWIYSGTEYTSHVTGRYLSAVDSETSDAYWLTTTSFINPSALKLGDCSTGLSGFASAENIKQLPSQFNAENLVETQEQAVSADGTVVPYFLVHKANLVRDGSNPTLLYGYGGFEISLLPSYAALVGSAWLEKGYVYVSANIRGLLMEIVCSSYGSTTIYCSYFNILYCTLLYVLCECRRW